MIPSVGPLRGGPSVMVRRLAGGLVRSGIETHVATTNDDGPRTLRVPCGKPVVEDGVTFWYFPRQTHFYTFSRPLGTWLARHVSKFDLVHIHALFSYPTLPAAFWARRRGVPYIVRPLGTLNEWGMRNRRPWLKTLSFRLLESRILKNAALVHYTSEQERAEAQLLQETPYSAVIPNAIAESPDGIRSGRFIDRFPNLRGRRLVLFLSRFDEKKGLDLLLRAFAEVAPRLPDLSLVLAGHGDASFVSWLKAEATALEIDSKIVWPGFLREDEKSAAFADADVFVLPSYSENFGIAVAEAMAAGLPVIVSNQVAIHRDVAKAEAGLVVPCEAAQLAGALLELLNNAAARRSMGDNGKAFARSNYSEAAMARRMIAAYNEVVH
ncbi:MAG TPA: glycosyltransferase [Vicinamibacterales bacterium]|nr:glycosyltransferase [Vicinamibacterales bacterium]